MTSQSLIRVMSESRAEDVDRDDLAQRYESMARDYEICAKSGRCNDQAALFIKAEENYERARRIRAGFITVVK